MNAHVHKRYLDHFVRFWFHRPHNRLQSNTVLAHVPKHPPQFDVVLGRRASFHPFPSVNFCYLVRQTGKASDETGQLGNCRLPLLVGLILRITSKGRTTARKLVHALHAVQSWSSDGIALKCFGSLWGLQRREYNMLQLPTDLSADTAPHSPTAA